jgi:hypothetical protein
MLDRVDGGVTLLIRTPGYCATPDLSIDDVTLDAYFPPRELHEGGQKLRSILAGFMRAFGKEIALPHLRQFVVRCGHEGVRNPPHPPRKAWLHALIIILRLDYPAYGVPLGGENLVFPDPVPKGSSRLRCRCCSSLIQRGADSLVPVVQDLTLKNGIDAPGPAIASLPVNPRSSLQLDNPARTLKNAIISMGSNTDTALDRFHLDDNLIPQLRTLVTTTRSSKWEAKLRGRDWGLSYEQAVTLSNALHADLGVARLVTVQVRWISKFRSIHLN